MISHIYNKDICLLGIQYKIEEDRVLPSGGNIFFLYLKQKNTQFFKKQTSINKEEIFVGRDQYVRS